MSLSRETQERIEQLLDTDNLTDAERSELNKTLLLSHEARKFAYRSMEMTSMMHGHILDGHYVLEGHPMNSIPIPSDIDSIARAKDTTQRDDLDPHSGTRLRPWQPILWIAASIALIGLGAWWVIQNTTPHRSGIQGELVIADQEPTQSGFAVIAKQADAVWATNTSFREGDLIGSKLLHLQSGTVRLELLSGVSIQVEGDARFEIFSPMEMHVHQGKARATVPPAAQGFRLRTDAGEIVDLGTEFGVNVSENQCDVHVLDGEITWTGTNDTQRSLLGGQAVRRTSSGDEQLISLDRDLFLDDADLEMRSTAAREERLKEWRQAVPQIHQDPRLVCFYEAASTGPQSRRIPNRKIQETASPDASVLPHVGEGAIVAANRTTDRFHRPNAALDFGPTGSSVRLLIPGEYQALTLSCWVKINGLDRMYNSLFLTDGHDRHEPHWQITGEGRMFFSVKRRDGPDFEPGLIDKQICFSPVFWNSSLSGQWIMLTTTYDSDSRLVTHFLNGNRISQETLSDEYVVETVKIGRASICNWNEPKRDDPEFAVRNLNGSLDEFSMYEVALDESEVAKLFELGKP